MPLPSPPAKRAALLSDQAYDLPARAASTAAHTDSADAGLGSRLNLVEQGPINRPLGLDADDGEARPKAQLARNRAKSSPAAPSLTALPGVALRQLPASANRSRKPKHSGPPKLFVLDTNVLLHDPMCLFRFEEHDIFLPMIVLEELDGHKKGTTEVARNARQTSRTLDILAGHQGGDIGNGLLLNTTGQREAKGKLFFQTQVLNYALPSSLPQGKADNQILGVVDALRQQHAPREVVLVSKDINMRVKSRALGLATDDYQNDKTLEDGDLLYSGSMALPVDFWTTHGNTVESWQQGLYTFYRITGPIVPSLLINQLVYFEAPGEPSLYARVTEIRGTTAVFKTLKDYT
ncbi:MAG: PIN domain-containing protein, partial [Burkholderiales bacterium]|nr:PIN domain-containing protein [Burkholderiales bacterium]